MTVWLDNNASADTAAAAAAKKNKLTSNDKM